MIERRKKLNHALRKQKLKFFRNKNRTPLASAKEAVLRQAVCKKEKIM
jgi:hypothetical protein